jgi:hypothetical protein
MPQPPPQPILLIGAAFCCISECKYAAPGDSGSAPAPNVIEPITNAEAKESAILRM